MGERWWEITKIKRKLEALKQCECKVEMKGDGSLSILKRWSAAMFASGVSEEFMRR